MTSGARRRTSLRRRWPVARHSARLVARVVLVPAGAGAADARRRVADVLLRAAAAGIAPSDIPAPEAPANELPSASGEKAA